MRQRYLFLIVMCTLLLAACGNNAPTATQPPAVQQNNVPSNNTIPTASAPVPTNGPREYGTEEVTLPEAGTIIPPATEDPKAGNLFDSVALDRMGGVGGKPLDIILLKDGTLTRDGVKSNVPADQVKQISDALDKLGIFGLQGIFQGAGTSPDMFTYYLTVEREGASRTITAQEGFIPPELASLFQTLQQLGA